MGSHPCPKLCGGPHTTSPQEDRISSPETQRWAAPINGGAGVSSTPCCPTSKRVWKADPRKCWGEHTHHKPRETTPEQRRGEKRGGQNCPGPKYKTPGNRFPKRSLTGESVKTHEIKSGKRLKAPEMLTPGF